MNILYVNPVPKLCGIYQFGHRVYKHLAASEKWNVHFREIGSHESLVQAFEEIKPDVTLYSTNMTTVPWAYNPHFRTYPGLHIGLSHEPEQCMLHTPYGSDYYNGSAFPYWVGFDPTLDIPRDNGRSFKATRPITRVEYTPPPERMTIGCQCFGFPGRGHRTAIEAIQREFDDCVIRFNMPPSHWGDPALGQAHHTANTCARLVNKPGIEFQASHHFFETEEEIIDWVAGNSANIYFYEQNSVPDLMRGVASSPDLSIAARRPTLVGACSMFRHLHSYVGSYPYEGSLPQLYQRAIDNKTMEYLYDLWTPETMVSEFEDIFTKLM